MGDSGMLRERDVEGGVEMIWGGGEKGEEG